MNRQNPDTDLSNDRLASALFLTALFHGLVIMGVTFAPHPAPASASHTLEVVIMPLPELDQLAPDEAEYLARVNRRGGGNTNDQVRPSSEAASHVPFDNPGMTDGTALDLSQVGDPAQLDLLVTRQAERPVPSMPDAVLNSADRLQVAQHLEASDALLLPTDSEDERAKVRGEVLREKFISPDTREAIFAEYLAGWKRKIERLGTLDYPDAARHSELSGSPTLEVAIRADGALHEVIVRQSSGHLLLDRAAKEILQRAAPFDPFPREIRQEYKILRFAYEWQFLNGETTGSILRASLPEEPPAYP